MSTGEVTQAEYRNVTNTNPSVNVGDQLPVDNVSWWDAIRYCNQRSEREGLEPCYNLSTGSCDRSKNGYRLLTDAEWAYAAGKTSVPADIRKYANLGDDQTKDTRKLLERLASTGTVPAGALLANEHGLFNTIGNVWEWVQDGSSFSKVIRGGSYISSTSRWGGGYKFFHGAGSQESLHQLSRLPNRFGGTNSSTHFTRLEGATARFFKSSGQKSWESVASKNLPSARGSSRLITRHSTPAD